MTAPSVNAASDTLAIELSIVIPCLNEAETLGTCIRQACDFLTQHRIVGEIVVADNGSVDGSQEIARALHARVIDVPVRGYGAALRAGIDAARGRYVAIGDGDGSYDFGSLVQFVAALRSGADIAVGDRFKGGIAPGAMPWLHRYFGNPFLSFLGRLFFGLSCRDLHCGLRAFSRASILKLDLKTTGMEYASEMLVRAGLAGLSIVDVPVRLHRDGRTRAPHLRTFRDGWRHLRFLLLLAPNWLFVYPGLLMLACGLAGELLLLLGPFTAAAASGLNIHAFLIACFSFLLGLQSVTFGMLARRNAVSRGFLPPARFCRILDYVTLEHLPQAGAAMALLGLAGCAWSFWVWRSAAYEASHPVYAVRLLAAALTLLASGLQLRLATFLAGVMSIE